MSFSEKINEYAYLQDLFRRWHRAHSDTTFEAHVQVDKGFEVNVRQQAVESVEYHLSRSLQVTVYAGRSQGSASTSDLSAEAVTNTLAKAHQIAELTTEDVYAGLPPVDTMAWGPLPALSLYHPWAISTEAAVEKALQCEQSACENSVSLQSEGVGISTFEHFQIYLNSYGFYKQYLSSRHGISCSLLVTDAQGKKQRDYDYSSARDASDLQAVCVVAKSAAEKTLARQGARAIKTQKCPVLFHHTVAKGLLGTLVAAISGSHLYRKSSFLLGHLGARIFPETVTIAQYPFLPKALGSAPFDAEGVFLRENAYIDKGILTQYVLSSYSARRLGLFSTGNAGGVYNLQIKMPTMDFPTLLKTMERGLLVTELMGQGVNLLTGDYSRGAFGYWVENGTIQYPVEGVTIAGPLSELYQGFVAMGTDIDVRGNVRTGSLLIEQMTIGGEDV